MLFAKKSSRKQDLEEALYKKHESLESKIFKALKIAGGHGLYNYELDRIGMSWHRRIGDLRADGVNIQCVKVKNGIFKYYLNKGE